MTGGRTRTKPFRPSSRSRNMRRRRPTRLVLHLWPSFFVLCIYIFTLAPTVTGEDSGELIAAAYYFGVPHPPGYPLWTILCGIFTHLIPVGSIAWRANLFSAVCSAAAVQIMYFVLRQMRFRPFCAGCAAAACGFATAVWSQSVITEVYTLNLLMMSAIIWTTVHWFRSRNQIWLLWGALLFGLGMCNHHILGFAALGLVIWAVAIETKLLLDWRLIVKCIFVFLIGLLPYFYLMWAARRNVPVNWGETKTLAGVWEHASRGQYKSDAPIDAPIPKTAGLMAARMFYGLRWEVRQFTPVLAPLLMAGLIWLWRRKNWRVWFWWTITLSLCCGPLFLYIGGPRMDRQDQFVQKVFLTPLALISAVSLAAGLHWAAAAWRKLRRNLGAQVYRIAIRATPLAVVAIPLVAHWNENNLRRYWYAYDHAENILACMLPRAILFPSGDHNTFPLIYLIHVEGRRPDVTIADKYGYIDLDLYRNMPDNPGKPRLREQREAIEEWIIRTSRRPVYFTVKKPSAVENANAVPVGLLYHLLPEGKEFDTRSCWEAIHYRNLEGASAPIDHAATNILSDYYYALGAKAVGDDNLNEARRHFDESLRYAWGIKEIYNNVASSLAEAGMVDEAVGYYELAARLDWRYGPARWNLAKIFRATGRIEWAAKVFQDLTRAKPGDFRPYGELGFLYANYFNDRAKARHWWHESLRLNPRQPQIIQALAGSESRLVEKPDVSNIQPVKTAGRLEISNEFIDFGVIVAGTTPSGRVTLRNTGSEPLTGLAVEASCSCVVGALERARLAPLDSMELSVGLKTDDKLGEVKESLRISPDDPGHPGRVLRLRAQVVPELAAEPNEVQWFVLPNQEIEPRIITITSHSDRAFRILSVISSEHFRFSWPKDESDIKHVIEVRAESRFSKATSGHFEVHTTLADHSVIIIPFHIQLKNPAKVRPKVLYLGRIGRDQNVRRIVQIDGIQDDLALNLRNADSVAGLTARLRQANGRGTAWLLEVQMDGSQAKRGSFEHALLIDISGYDRPIEVKLYGNIAE